MTEFEEGHCKAGLDNTFRSPKKLQYSEIQLRAKMEFSGPALAWLKGTND